MAFDRLWVVEIFHQAPGRWEATIGTACTREAARRVLAEWRGRNPDDIFRLTPYRSEDHQKRDWT